MTRSDAASAYRRNAIMTASPAKLVLMLYDGAIRNLERSRNEMGDARTARSATAGECLVRALSIVSELRSSLDVDGGGPVAQDLDRLYEYALNEISTANLTRDPQHLDNTLRVLRTLKEGWDVVLSS